MGQWNLSQYSNLVRAGRSGNRIPVGTRYFTLIQTRRGANPASYTMGTGSFPGVKEPGRGVDHPLPSSAGFKERVEIYLYSPSGPSWPVLGWTLPLPLPVCNSGTWSIPVWTNVTLRAVKINIFLNCCPCCCCRELLTEVIQLLRNTANSQVEQIIRVMKRWAKDNRINI